MQAIMDAVISVFNCRHIGKELSKRPPGKVAISFVFLVAVYVAIFGIFYSSIAGKFIDVLFDMARPRLPVFDIAGGKLSMLSEEPYIRTHEDFGELILDTISEMNRRYYTDDTMQALTSRFGKGEVTTKDSFCLIMDTTGAYKERIDLDNYSKYVVVTKDSLEIVDRVKSMPGNVIALGEKIEQDIQFRPELTDRLKNPAKRFVSMGIAAALAFFVPIHFLVKALISAFLMWLILMMFKKEKPFKDLFRISLYALSPMVVLSVISAFWLPIHGLIFQVLYFAYIVAAIMAIPKISEKTT